MAYFKDADEVYAYIGRLFEELAEDEELSPKFQKATSIVQYPYRDPESQITVKRMEGEDGQVDCGSTSGNAADSASANEYDLGISETGEAAGVAICENIIGEALSMALGPIAAVIEDFIIDPDRMNTGRDFLSPVRVMSRLEQLLWESRSTTVHKQMASEKPTASDDRLQMWGM